MSKIISDFHLRVVIGGGSPIGTAALSKTILEDLCYKPKIKTEPFYLQKRKNKREIYKNK